MRLVTKLDKDELDEQWLLLKTGSRNESTTARDRLVMHYQPMVWSIANHIKTRLPPHVDSEDLASYGMIGLLDAIEKFDPTRGLKFQTYAGKRVSGQIFDELRKLDWVPRSVHAQVKVVAEAAIELERILGRTPNEQEIADHANLTREQVAEARNEQSHIGVMALDAMLDSPAIQDESLSLGDSLYDRTQSPHENVEVDGIKSLIAGVMSHLEKRETVVLALYYIEGLTLSDIGKLLGVTESRVCQMHTRAMVAVREKLAA